LLIQPDKKQQLREDDAGVFALEFVGARELASEEFDETAGTRAAVGAQKSHAVEEDNQLENFGVLGVAEGRLCGGLLCLGEKRGDGAVEGALDGPDRRLFVEDAGGEGFPGFGEGFEGGEDIGIGGAGFAGAEFRDGESDGGEKLRMQADEVRREADVEERSVRRKLARVLFLVAVGRDEISTVGRAVEGDFAFDAATDGADFFGLGWAKARGLAFFTDWTEHEIP